MRQKDWIKVTSEIPNAGQMVLLFVEVWDDSIFCIGRLIPDSIDMQSFESEFGTILNPPPTHWMPLPEPPKK